MTVQEATAVADAPIETWTKEAGLDFTVKRSPVQWTEAVEGALQRRVVVGKKHTRLFGLQLQRVPRRQHEVVLR